MKFSKFNLVVRDKNHEQPILFNTLSGSTFFVDEALARTVEAGDLSALDETATEYLTRAGVIIDDDTDENEIFSYNRNSVKFGNDFFSTTVFLTMACNLRCVYCFQEHDNAASHMSTEIADRYIKFVKDSTVNKGCRNVAVTLFGGEPLLNIDVGYHILGELQKFCTEKDLGFDASIITNGTLLTDEIINRLISYGCRSIQVTLDGVREIHDSRRITADGGGSFDKTIEAIKLLCKYRTIDTVIRINVDRTNLESTSTLLDYIGKDGIDLTRCYVDFGIVKGDSKACANYAGKCLVENEIGDALYSLWKYAESKGFKYDIAPARRFIYCGLYRENNYTIMPNGDVYKCWEHAGEEEHRVGMLDNIGRFCNRTPAFYKWMTADPLKNDDCGSCPYLPSCGGGCGVISYNDTGTYCGKGCYGEKQKIERYLTMFVDKTLAERKRRDEKLKEQVQDEKDD